MKKMEACLMSTSPLCGGMNLSQEKKKKKKLICIHSSKCHRRGWEVSDSANRGLSEFSHVFGSHAADSSSVLPSKVGTKKTTSSREEDPVCCVLVLNSRSQNLLPEQLIKVLSLVICGNGNYWHALRNMRLKADKTLPDSYLQFTGRLWRLTPLGGWVWSNVLCAGFYLFHENIIYILMPGPEEYNLERTTPNRCCNINGRRSSSGTSSGSWKSERLRSEVTTHRYDRRRKPDLRRAGFRFSAGE